MNDIVKVQVNLKSQPPASNIRNRAEVDESDIGSRPTTKMPIGVSDYLVGLTAMRTYLVSKTMGEWRGQAKSVHHALMLSYKAGVRGHINYIDDNA